MNSDESKFWLSLGDDVVRRKMTCSFKNSGTHEFVVEMDKHGFVRCSEMKPGSSKLPNKIKEIKGFTQLDGLTQIIPEMVYEGDNVKIMLVSVNVVRGEESGFYIYYVPANNSVKGEEGKDEHEKESKNCNCNLDHHCGNPDGSHLDRSLGLDPRV